MRWGERGVTLIEIAVVMAIVAIAALFMAPALGEWMHNFRIRQAGRELLSDLQFAKMKAISMGRNCAVVFNQDVGGTEYAYVIFPDYNNDLKLDNVNVGDLDGDGDEENETTDIFRMVLLKQNVVFDTSEGAGDGIEFLDVDGHPAVAFNPQGMPRDTNGPLGIEQSVFLQHTKNNKGREVGIWPAGRISTNEY